MLILGVGWGVTVKVLAQIGRSSRKYMYAYKWRGSKFMKTLRTYYADGPETKNDRRASHTDLSFCCHIRPMSSLLCKEAPVPHKAAISLVWGVITPYSRRLCP